MFFSSGFYCPEGTEQAQTCPANTVRSSPGAVSLQDCLACPPQYWCKPGKSWLCLELMTKCGCKKLKTKPLFNNKT